MSPLGAFAPRQLTSMTDQVKDWTLASREVISWKSKDGTTIEGVLIKPADFDPTKKYPLLCVIHGGPTGIDRPTLLDTRYYPTDIWAAKGALMLKVNYRGSAGYGEKFRAAQRPQPRRRRRVGRALRRRLPDCQGLGRSSEGRLHGLEPGRLHLGVPHHVDRPLRGDLGRRGHLQLGDLLLQHRHHAVHASSTSARTRATIRRSTRRRRR